jgi:hypothetical protein
MKQSNAAELFWQNATEWTKGIGVYSRPKSHYEYWSPALRNATNNASGPIVLVGNLAAGEMFRASASKNTSKTQSRKYVELVERFFEEQHFRVQTELSDTAQDSRCHTADCDFVRMAAAPCFAPAGGGFSRLIADVVAARGGRVIGVAGATAIAKWSKLGSSTHATTRRPTTRSTKTKSKAKSKQRSHPGRR